MDDKDKAKKPSGYLRSVHGMDEGFHRELDLPLPPSHMDGLISEDAVRLHRGNVIIIKWDSLDEVHPAITRPVLDLLAHRTRQLSSRDV